MKPLVIIDGNNQIYRSEWGSGLYHNNQRVSGILTFLRSLKKIARDVTDSWNIIICWDTRPRKKEIYTEYKAGRVRDGFFREIMSEINVLEVMLKILGIRQIKVEGYEADELIADIVYNAEGKKIIYSTDSDCFQLLSDDTIIQRGQDKYTLVNLMEQFGMNPVEFFMYKVISGDMMDNVDGIKGLGKARFLKILEECNRDLERILYHPKIRPHLKLIERNLQLIKLDNHRLLETKEVINSVVYPDLKEFRVLCFKYGLWSIMNTFQSFTDYFRRSKNPRSYT